MKKSTILLDILAGLAFLGAYEMRRFAAHRIGFVRWLNFNGAKLREALPLDAVKYAALAVTAVIVLIAAIRLLRRRSELTTGDKVMAVIMTGTFLFYVHATMNYTYAFSPASFLLVPLIALGTLLVTARNFLSPSQVKKSDEK